MGSIIMKSIIMKSTTTGSTPRQMRTMNNGNARAAEKAVRALERPGWTS